MKKTSMMIILLLLISIILVGCNTNKNQYGIKEKETDEYISVYTNEDDLWYLQGVYLQLNFLNENVSYDVYSKNGEFGYDYGNHFVFNYDNKDSEELRWSGGDDFHYKTFYIDVIIMENNSIIGYAVVKINYNEVTRHEVSMIKQVIFPNAINKKIELTEKFVRLLIEENKQYVTDINEINEENTDEFVSLLQNKMRITPIEYKDSIEGVKLQDFLQLNFVNDDYVYNVKTKEGLLDYRFTNVKEKSYVSRHSTLSHMISIYWDIPYEDEINDIKNVPLTYVDVIVYEGDSIVGYAVIKIEKTGVTDNKLVNIYSFTIIKQVKFPNEYYDYQNVTKEQVEQLIKNCKEGK